MTETANDPTQLTTQFPSLGVPVFYADQAIGIAINGFTTKLVFAMENPGGPISPALTLVIPTNVAIGIAKQLTDAFSSQELQGELAKAYQAQQDSLPKSAN